MQNNRLQKSLSWPQGTAMTVGAVLGSGVLVLPAATAQMAGPASLLAWLLMGVLTLPLALTLGYLAIHHPDAGGVAAYARKAFGPLGGAITGWVSLYPLTLMGLGYLSYRRKQQANSTLQQ
ncbi:MAG: hypothetical protein JG781_1541 [Peptococcaceae bacterium]|nr:hypothetical protein [Peptococcaceae bacterium]